MRGPLTFQQQFLWDYFNLQNGERPRDASIFRIVGSLDSALLTESLNEVVRRHDCLRTRIVTTDGVLEQHVDESAVLGLQIVDLRGFTQRERERQAREFIDEFAGSKCDLAVGAPIDAALIHMSTQEHLFAWAVHHVVADGISNSIVLAELWSVYCELLQGQPRPARSPVRYLDYALWQHATQDDWLHKHGPYWKDRIAAAARVHWPPDPHVGRDQPTNAWYEMDFGPIPWATLRRVAQRARTTPAMVMLTIYAAVVASWCGQSTLTIPVNIAGRHRSEHEYAAGYFAQFLYVAVEITANQTFLELLARVSAEFRGALLHQDFGKVAARAPDVLLGSMFSWLPWDRATFGHAASSVSKKLGFAVETYPFTPPRMPLLEFQGIGTFFFESAGEYSAALWYRTDVFSAGTVERFALELRNYCERALTSQDGRLLEQRDG